MSYGKYNKGGGKGSNYKGGGKGSQSYGPVRPPRLSAKQWEVEKGSLGTRARTNIWLPGPHHTFPPELEEIASRTSINNKRPAVVKVVECVHT